MAKMTLKAARINAGYSQKSAAAKLGVSNSTLGRWENRLSFPNAEKIDALCSLYGLTYDDIIF